MTKLLDEAVQAVRRMPSNSQDIIAEAMLSMTGRQTLDDIEPEHHAAVMEGLAQAERGEFASPDAVVAAFRRFER